MIANQKINNMKLTPSKKILKNIKVGDIFICINTESNNMQKYIIKEKILNDKFIKLRMSLDAPLSDWSFDIKEDNYFDESVIVNKRYKWYIK